MWLLYGVLISAFLFVAVASFLGWRFDVVPTGSMAPAFNPGGMAITRPAVISDIEVGDPVLFREMSIEGEAHVCHRVIDIRESDGQAFLQTKGDANEYPDAELVSTDNLVGKTVLYIPHVGSIAHLTRLHEAPLAVMGRRISLATLLVFALGLIVISTELANVAEWLLWPHTKRHRELLANRRQRLIRRRHEYT